MANGDHTWAHALSVDVEDYFQVLNLAKHVDRRDWDRLELRCGESTRQKKPSTCFSGSGVVVDGFFSLDDLVPLDVQAGSVMLFHAKLVHVRSELIL